MNTMHGAFAFAAREEVAHARGADADEHLDELGAAEIEERHAGLAGNGARQQRLAGAGRADQQHALRQLGAEAGVLGGILEEGDDLLRLLDRLVDAGDVGERHARGRIGLVHLRLALPDVEHAAAAAAHAPHQVSPDDEHDAERAGSS